MTRTRRSIELTTETRRELEVYTKAGTRSVKLIKWAAIILTLDTADGWKLNTETDIANHVGGSSQTFQTVKKDFGETADLKAFLQHKKRETPLVPAKVTGKLQARIIAL